MRDGKKRKKGEEEEEREERRNGTSYLWALACRTRARLIGVAYLVITLGADESRVTKLARIVTAGLVARAHRTGLELALYAAVIGGVVAVFALLHLAITADSCAGVYGVPKASQVVLASLGVCASRIEVLGDIPLGAGGENIIAPPRSACEFKA
jgi:hypothetical protein